MTYDKAVIDRNINIDIMDMMSEGVESRLTAGELLPVAAASVTRFDFTKPYDGNVLYEAVERLMKGRKLVFTSYDREGTINALQDRWCAGLDDAVKEVLLAKSVALIESFTDDGYAVFKPRIYEAYRKVMDGGRFSRIEYGRDGFGMDKEKEWKAIVDMSRDTVLEGHRLWSWKCNSQDYENGLPEELCCVGDNEWYNDSLMNLKQWEVGGRGSVSRAWYDFAHTIKEGDFVLYRDWEKNVIVGIGRFKGEYRYEPKHENFRSRRYVEWGSKKLIPSPVNIGRGNTSPMVIDDPEVFASHLEIIKGL